MSATVPIAERRSGKCGGYLHDLAVFVKHQTFCNNFSAAFAMHRIMAFSA